MERRDDPIKELLEPLRSYTFSPSFIDRVMERVISGRSEAHVWAYLLAWRKPLLAGLAGSLVACLFLFVFSVFPPPQEIDITQMASHQVVISMLEDLF